MWKKDIERKRWLLNEVYRAGGKGEMIEGPERRDVTEGKDKEMVRGRDRRLKRTMEET